MAKDAGRRRAGRIRTEPLAAGSRLGGAPNLILTPRIAGLTAESNARVTHMIAERVNAALGDSVARQA